MRWKGLRREYGLVEPVQSHSVVVDLLHFFFTPSNLLMDFVLLFDHRVLLNLDSLLLDLMLFEKLA